MTRWRWLALLLLPLALATGLMLWSRRPMEVPVAALERDVPIRVFGLGTVEARVLSRIGFDVPGVLIALTADHGDQVAAGTVLARLDPSAQRARLARAEAAVQSAEAQQGRVGAAFERATALYQQKRSTAQRRRELANRGTASLEAAELAETEAATALADLGLARADLAVARAALADAEASLLAERTALAKHELRAPYDALVIARQREPGSALAPGEAVFTLVAPDSLWALAHVDEARAGAIREGQPASVRLRSLPGEIFSARVVRVGLEADRTTEERRVNLRCERCPERPVIGEQLTVEIETGRLPEARLVPEAAVTGFDGRTALAWVVENGALHQRRLSFSGRTLDARLALAPDTPRDLAVAVRVLPGFREGRAARPAS
jgi:HlyD family secretion protein